MTITTLATELFLRDLVDVTAGRYHRESGTIVHQDNGLLTIRSANNNNLEVFSVLSILSYCCPNHFTSKMIIPFHEVQKVLTHSDPTCVDVSPHIVLRSLVRVLRGTYQHRQGVVSEKFNRGQELVIMDPDNNENVSFPQGS